MIGWFDAHAVSMVDGVAFGLLYFTLAVGLSLVFGMMDVLNLAHGTLYLAGAYVAYLLSDGGWTGLLIGLGAGIAVGLAGGALLAALTQPLAHRGHLDQALLTLGLSIIGAEIFLVSSGGETLATDPPAALRGSVQVAGHTYPSYRLVFIGIAGMLALAVYLAFERSALGALVRATVADRDMVRVLGVDTRRVLFGVFAAGSVLAVVGGVLGAPILGPSPGIDGHVLVLSLVVIVIGGLGSVRGALLGALLVGEVDTLGRAIAPSYAAFLLFGAMFVVLAVRPRGLVAV
ncbi:MAG TPA: branched-chain amino acid ABC transporter permease [Micromonosporaceae bacterium]|nr:branched-chain amino acid ABC transporter permease [Micromonosporaceae bacterium]